MSDNEDIEKQTPQAIPIALQKIMKKVIALHLQPLLCSHFEDFVDEKDLSCNISFFNTIDLTFPNHIHHLIALESTQTVLNSQSRDLV